jgi:uncharacterized membrane protein (DUF4010 family)
MSSDGDVIFQRLGLALAIGLLVGLERGWKAREEAEGERVAGLRTYALSGLLGGLSALIAIPGSPIFLPVAFAVYAATMALFHYRAAGDLDFSVTSVVASLLTFALGAFAILGDPKVAGASAVAMTLLLAFKEPLHSWLKNLTWPEIRSFFTLIAMTFLLLPILPSRAIDPWGLIVPAEIWLFAILIAGMSFVGYVAIKAMGPEIGTALAGLAGGLASSTATTLTFARLSREQTSSEQLLAGGVLLAGAVMVARVLIIVTAINAGLLLPLIGPLGAAFLLLLSVGGYLSLRQRQEKQEEKEPQAIIMDSPFNLRSVLGLAAFIAAVMVLSQLAARFFGASGTYAVAAVSAMADVDAIALSLARQAYRELPIETATIGIGIAVAINTMTKAGMAMIVGERQFGLIVSSASAAAIVLGGVVWFLHPIYR